MGATWFDVDKEGLRKLLERRGRAFAILELIQNAWDTNATDVHVSVTPIPGKALVKVQVVDNDPDGFRDLSHAYTLFAESTKKGQAEKRGRFNLGEKLVLALCSEATISTTTGTVVFTKNSRQRLQRSRVSGSCFEATMHMTRDDIVDVARAMSMLLVPENILTGYNGAALEPRRAVGEDHVALPIDIAGEDGVLRRSTRLTRVSVHPVLDGETPHLYEMGIPVVELSGGERWHINVHQKVPLNMDRDNVTPAYLRTIRVALANTLAKLGELEETDGASTWLSEATADARCDAAAVERMLDLRFGKHRVSYDPSDVESNKTAVNRHHTVIAGGSLSGAQWDVAKRFGLVKAAGQVFPSGLTGEPTPLVHVPPSEAQMRFLARAAHVVHACDHDDLITHFQLVRNPTIRFRAWCNRDDQRITFNTAHLADAWFHDDQEEDQVALVLHELAHVHAHDHLTMAYLDALAMLGARLAIYGMRRVVGGVYEYGVDHKVKALLDLLLDSPCAICPT